MSRTKDEQFIICAFEAGSKAGDVYMIQNRYEVGRRAGITEKGVNAICNLLARANFIKKVGEVDMYLTENGENLALQLLDE